MKVLLKNMRKKLNMQIKHLKGEIKIKNKLIKQLENYNIEKFDIKNDLIKIKKEKNL